MTKALWITLWSGLGLLLLHAGLRAGFYLVNAPYFEGVPPGEIARAFLHGLRFDVAGLTLLNLPVLVLLHAPLPTRKPRAWLVLTFVLFAGLNTAGLLLNAFDCEYYASVQRRMLFEPFHRPQDLLANVTGWWAEYPVAISAVGAALLVFVYGAARFLRFLGARIAHKPGAVRSHVCALALVGLGVLAVRGGLQVAIMRPADAFVHSQSQAVGNLTLNSTYTVLLSAFLPRHPVVRKLPEEEALATAAALVLGEGEHLLDPRFPFLRQRTPGAALRPLNVVVLIQESWTAAQVGPDAGGASRTPFFDELCAEGAHYVNFLANGQRSGEAVPAIVAAVPSLFPTPIIGSQIEMTRFRGLGDLLGPLGYRTSFHYGAARTLEGFHAFTRMVGFQDYVSREDYDGDEPDADRSDGTWGIYDELFYRHAARYLDARPEPFATVVFGLSPHDPYRLPRNREALFPVRPGETPYQRMLRYSDHSLRAFFEHARQSPWFSRTLFVITGDHTRFSPPESFYESFRVPLLLYAPGLVEPAVREDVGCHADILPTILDLLHAPVRHASMGRSLRDTSRSRVCVVQRGQRFVIFDDERAYVHDLRRDLGFFAYRSDRRFREDLTQREPEAAAALRHKLFAYLQACTTTLVGDRVWPRAER